MKTTAIPRISLLALLLMLLISCNRTPDYRIDVDIESIAQTITPILDHSETMIRYDADQIHFFLGLPEPYCSDSVVMVQSKAGTVEEYGIFRCNNENDAEELEEMLDDYLELTIPGKLAYLNECNSDKDSSATESATDTTVQTANNALTGRVRRYGIYVCYTILDHEDDLVLQKELKSLLKEE